MMNVDVSRIVLTVGGAPQRRRRATTMFGTVGVPEMAVIFIVALVLFGPKKLPELGRTIGKAITEFRRATSDLKSSFEREMHALERETEGLKEATNSADQEIRSHSTYEY